MKNSDKPLVSIVMPVYNAGSFLVEAVESIKSQTYSNWELIAVDDCSTDNSLKILRKLAKTDSRIKVYLNKKNGGVSTTANFALKRAIGEFIARMDADDVSLPTRIEKQVNYLSKHPGLVACGGQCDVINAVGDVIGEKRFPIKSEDIYKLMFVRIPVQQPSVMVNTALLPKNFHWYDNKFTVAEEVELMFKFFKFGKVANLGSKLLQYRIHGNNTSLVDPKRTFFQTLKTRIRAIKKYGYRPSLGGVATTIAQAIVVSILPSDWIYPIYLWSRDVKKLAFISYRRNLSTKVATSYQSN